MKYDNTHIELRNNKYGSSVIEKQNDVEGETFGKRPDGTSYQKILAVRDVNPPFKVGDYLYVRETWCKYFRLEDDLVTPIDGTEKYYYRADGENPTPFNTFLVQKNGYDEYSDQPKWHPSIHMHKEAARIFLRVTSVRVQRLHDITVNDIYNEGIPKCFIASQCTGVCDNCLPYNPLKKFLMLWNRTVKKSDLTKYGWDANPWVWVIEFERMEVE